jgi:hypothetical protein
MRDDRLSEVRRLISEPLFIVAAAVGVVVLVFLLWRAPGNPEVPALAVVPQVTPFPTFTAGPSPTFGPPPTLGPPTATPTPDMSSATRDEQRRADLTTIVPIIQEYAREEGEVPATGTNPQSFCTYKEIDVACAFEEYAEGGTLPPSPPGAEPYTYFSSDGQSWAVFIQLENPLTPADVLCAHPGARGLPKPDRVICATGDGATVPGATPTPVSGA